MGNMQASFQALFIFFVGCFNIYSTNASVDHDWDILIFTQHWPLTVCLQWKEVLPQHTCSLPPIKNIWTVHGIWPTKLGTRGPQFCNSSLHFNETQLAPIEDQLKVYWRDIHNGTGSIYQLWKHEWKKHGSCTVTLPALNSEFKYFSQGLKWINEYGMANILSKSGIEPSLNYTPEVVWNTVQKTLGKNPAVQCIVDPKTKESYLFEIRICFDKNFTLIDCDGISGHKNDSTRIKTNCPDHSMVYPGALPTQLNEAPFNIYKMYDHRPWMLEAIRIIQFLQWMTF